MPLGGLFLASEPRRLLENLQAARGLAQGYGWQAEFSALDGMIGALRGTRAAERLKAAKGRVRAVGQPYDAARLPLFDAPLSRFNREPLESSPSGR